MTPRGRMRSRARCRTATGGVVCMALAGCLSPALQHADATRQRQAALIGQTDRYASALTDRQARIAAQSVDAPWLTGRATALAREATLPRALQANVDTTLLFADGPTDLPLIARRIQRAVGIPVRVLPDAMLPAHYFLPRLTGVESVTAIQPTNLPLRTGPAPLPRLLDDLAASLGVSWRYRAGHIEFFQVDTRVFRVRALSMAARAEAQLGRAGREAQGGSGGFQNTSQTVFSTGAVDTLEAIEARLQPFMTRAGILAVHPGGDGTLVVTDTLAVLNRIDAFLKVENRALTRRVRLVFEEVTVDTHDLQSRAIDWSAVYAAGRVAASLTTGIDMPDHAVIAQAGPTAGPWTRSAGLVGTLSQYTHVLRHTRVPLSTLNRRPVTHAVRTTFSYVDQVQRGGTRSAGEASAPDVGATVSQKEETVGAFLTVLPDIQDDGRMMLSVAYDNTVAQPLKVLTVGEGAQSVHVQQVAIDGSGTVQQIELRAGEPSLIAGFDRLSQDGDARRLAPGWSWLLGGTDRLTQRRVTTLIFVTAQIEETAE